MWPVAVLLELEHVCKALQHPFPFVSPRREYIDPITEIEPWLSELSELSGAVGLLSAAVGVVGPVPRAFPVRRCQTRHGVKSSTVAQSQLGSTLVPGKDLGCSEHVVAVFLGMV